MPGASCSVNDVDEDGIYVTIRTGGHACTIGLALVRELMIKALKKRGLGARGASLHMVSLHMVLYKVGDMDKYRQAFVRFRPDVAPRGFRLEECPVVLLIRLMSAETSSNARLGALDVKGRIVAGFAEWQVG